MAAPGHLGGFCLLMPSPPAGGLHALPAHLSVRGARAHAPLLVQEEDLHGPHPLRPERLRQRHPAGHHHPETGVPRGCRSQGPWGAGSWMGSRAQQSGGVGCVHAVAHTSPAVHSVRFTQKCPSRGHGGCGVGPVLGRPPGLWAAWQQKPGRGPRRGWALGQPPGSQAPSLGSPGYEPTCLLPQAVGPGGVAGPVQIVNNKFLAWSGVMEWQEVRPGDLGTNASSLTQGTSHS